MVMTVIVMMVTCPSSHIYDSSRYRQYRRILILEKLDDVPNDDIKEQNEPDDHK